MMCYQSQPSCGGDVQVIKPPDPRIHFALVCGAKSCPPIKVCVQALMFVLPWFSCRDCLGLT